MKKLLPLLIYTWLSACGVAQDGVQLDKQTAAQTPADEWTQDHCETEAWYADGTCDAFCPRPDADCACTPEQCGPGPLLPSQLCDDGSVAGPECGRSSAGICGWTVTSCPDADPAPCQDVECPNAPGAPNFLCDDGTVGGPACLRDDQGVCGWEFLQCDDVTCDCGPEPDWPITLCPDGKTISGPECLQDDTDVEPYTCSWHLIECPPVAACEPDECGPAPEAPNRLCADGSIGGPSCERDASGACGWQILPCPGDACDENECGGPAPAGVSWICDDGSIGGPACVVGLEGVCGWHRRQCPREECKPGECGPDLDAPLILCPDGVTVSGPSCELNYLNFCAWEFIECPM